MMKIRLLSRKSLFAWYGTACLTALWVVACGEIGGELKKYHKELAEKPDTAERTNANLNADGIVPLKCSKPKDMLQLASGAMQLAWGRTPNTSEKSEIIKKDFAYEAFVDKMLASPSASYAIGKFITNALGLNNINPDPDINDNDDALRIKDAMQVADLRKEPIKLVEHVYFSDEPWSKVFSADFTFCTKNTAEFYNARITDSDAFVQCELPDDRKAGILGLVSTMRANPSSILTTNNNYHRVALVVYLTLGFKLLAATNGPTDNEGKGKVVPACVPTIDNRVAASGLIYGTMAIPAVDATCAECHSRYHVGLKQAFTRIAANGRSLTFTDIDEEANQVITDLGTTRDFLKRMLNEETDSCWNPKEGPFIKYSGLPGLAKILVEGGTLGRALSNIIPVEWANEPANANSSSTILHYFNKDGETLRAAFKGYLMSESYACEIPAEKK